jgi:hypothetical protein
MCNTRFKTGLFIACLMCAMALAGCTTQGGGTGPIFFPGTGGGISGLDRGSALQSQLTDDDRQNMGTATGELLSAGATNATRDWRGGSGDTGTARLGGPVLVGLDALSGAPIPAPETIDTSVALEAATGNYLVAVKSLYVRLGPSLTAPVAQTLSGGTLVRAYAKTADWLLVGDASSIYGYAFESLLTAQGGGDPVLAGGKARRPRLCRTVSLSASLAGGQRDLWSALVCKRDDGGWEVPAERGLS